MDHLLVGFYIFASMLGIVTITLGILAYVNYEVDFFISISLNLIVISLLVIFQGIELYIKVNLINIENVRIIIRNSNWIVMTIMIFSMPMLIHQLFDIKSWNNRRYIFLIVSGIMFVLMIVNLISSNRIWLNISLLFFYSSMIYCVIIIFLNRDFFPNKTKKKVLKTYLVAAIILIPFLFLDTQAESIFNIRFIKEYGLLSLPIFYIVINVLTIYWVSYLNKKIPNMFKISQENKNLLDKFFELYKITNREKDVVNCLINGYSYDEIAKSLYVSRSTVKTHIINVYRKVEVNNKVELINTIYYQ